MSELNLCEEYDDVKSPCDASIYSRGDGTWGMQISCPHCGHISTGTHVLTTREEGGKTLYSLHPSLVMSGCCGWHGHLTDNVFRIA